MSKTEAIMKYYKERKQWFKELAEARNESYDTGFSDGYSAGQRDAVHNLENIEDETQDRIGYMMSEVEVESALRHVEDLTIISDELARSRQSVQAMRVIVKELLEEAQEKLEDKIGWFDYEKENYKGKYLKNYQQIHKFVTELSQKEQKERKV